MANHDKEKLDQYAKAVIDYLNADNLNEAFFGLLDNIEKVLGFDDGWANSLKRYGVYCELEDKPDFPEVIIWNPDWDHPDLSHINWPSSHNHPSWHSYERYQEYLSNLSYQTNRNIEKITGHIEPAINSFYDIRKNGHILVNESFSVLLNIYNAYCRSFISYNVIMLNDDSFDNEFKPEPPFDEASFSMFYRNEDDNRLMPVIITEKVFLALVFCLVEYIIDSKDNRFKIKKCPFCEKYFPAKNLKRTRCYRPACEKAYQREKKQKQRDKNPVKYV